jgi:tRNA(Ile)-lysidine synthase
MKQVIEQLAVEQIVLALGPTPRLILGLSGGADSVCLLNLLAPLHAQGTIALHAIHINHHWRDTASRDEVFCKTLCAQLNIPFTAHDITPWYDRIAPHKAHSASHESKAREARRLIFEDERVKHNADAIVLAHHADDQIETFFIRLIRGASLAGLCGMSQYAKPYLRPLLTYSRAAIENWLSERNITFCHDETNSDMRFLRNRIRAHLIPSLISTDARAPQSLLAAMQHIGQDNDLLETLTQNTYESLLQPSGWLALSPLRAMHPALQKRVITTALHKAQGAITLSSSLLEEILRFLLSPRGGTHTIATCVLEKKGTLFRIKTPRQDDLKPTNP